MSSAGTLDLTVNRSTTDRGAAPATGPIATLLVMLLALAVDWQRQEVAV